MTKKIIQVLGILIILAILIPFIQNYGLDLVSQRAVDLPAFYFAATLAFEEDLTPYHPVHWRKAKALAGAEDDFWPYLYPPPSLFFFRPMVNMDYDQVKIGMIIFNYILTFTFIYLFFVKILRKQLSDVFTLAGIVYIFLFYPLASTIQHGQINLLILVLLCLTWYGLQEGKHPALIAFPLVAAIFLKITPVLFLIYLIMKKEYKVFLWVMALLLIIVVGSIFILPDEIWMDWYSSVARHGYGTTVLGIHPGSPSNQSINGFLYRFFWGRGRVDMLVDDIISLDEDVKANFAKNGTTIAAGVLTSITFLLIFLKSKRNMNDDALKLEISFLLILIFLVSPFSWDHHLVMILPAILVVLSFLVSYDKINLWSVFVIGAVLLLAYDYPFHSPLFLEGSNTLLIAAKLYAVSILWLFFAVVLSKPELNLSKNNQP